MEKDLKNLFLTWIFGIDIHALNNSLIRCAEDNATIFLYNYINDFSKNKEIKKINIEWTSMIFYKKEWNFYCLCYFCQKYFKIRIKEMLKEFVKNPAK